MVLCRAKASDFASQEITFDIKKCLEDFMDIFKANIDFYLTDRSCETDQQLKNSYLTNLWRLNVTASFIDYTTLPQGHLDGPMNISRTSSEKNDQCGTEFSGIIRGISELGMLMVEDSYTNLIRKYGFKEIGYILED